MEAIKNKVGFIRSAEDLTGKLWYVAKLNGLNEETFLQISGSATPLGVIDATCSLRGTPSVVVFGVTLGAVKGDAIEGDTLSVNSDGTLSPSSSSSGFLCMGKCTGAGVSLVPVFVNCVANVGEGSTPPSDSSVRITIPFARKGNLSDGNFMRIGEVELKDGQGFSVPFDCTLEKMAYSFKSIDTGVLSFEVDGGGTAMTVSFDSSDPLAGVKVPDVTTAKLLAGTVYNVKWTGAQCKETVLTTIFKEEIA